jgi:hypothetical protein
MVFLYVEKAFDSVWHEGLRHKLVIPNCYLYLTKIIASFLSGRSFNVSVNKTDSAFYSLWCSTRCHIVSFPICGWYFDLCVQRSGLQYIATTLWFFFHVLQAVEDWKKHGQDPGTIVHPMVVSKETANCSYQGWGPSYPMAHRSNIPWGYPRQETHIRRSHGQVYREIGESLSYIIFNFQ